VVNGPNIFQMLFVLLVIGAVTHCCSLVLNFFVLSLGFKALAGHMMWYFV